jgi:hypothetical protein
VQVVGAWLAAFAIALQVAWPLVVNAKPRSVALVPLCSVDGVTHYLELPTGKTPLEESVSHGDHCPLCFFGDRVGARNAYPIQSSRFLRSRFSISMARARRRFPGS